MSLPIFISASKHLYRYEGYDGYATRHPVEYCVLRETEKGYWISTGYMTLGEQLDLLKYKGPEKWVSKTGKKRFAYPTKEEAMVNYIARKKSQIKHCKNMIENAEKGLRNATGLYSYQILTIEDLLS